MERDRGMSVLRRHRRMLAVVAHPDDESFGLGAVITALTDRGVSVAAMCFTHGEASTLGADGGDLGRIRALELDAASQVLGINPTHLLDYPDGGLAAQPLEDLVALVRAEAESEGADALLVFDEGGITGHPDHRRATEAALVAAAQLDIAVLAWALPSHVARSLNAEFGTAFAGRDDAQVEVRLAVSRLLQHRAIDRHRSQAANNAVLWRRLELLGDHEALRVLRPGRAAEHAPTGGASHGAT